MKTERLDVTSPSKKAGTLLVLDDDPQLCRLMQRTLSPYFDKVLLSVDPLKANHIIESEAVTHLLADLNLEGTANGIVFLTFWRREFASIKRAVLITAYDTTDLALPEEVDAVVSKTDSVDVLLHALVG